MRFLDDLNDICCSDQMTCLVLVRVKLYVFKHSLEVELGLNEFVNLFSRFSIETVIVQILSRKYAQ